MATSGLNKILPPSHERKSKCPHCPLSILDRNLTRHISKKHPEKESKDRRSGSQLSVVQLWKSPQVQPASQSQNVVVENELVEEENEDRPDSGLGGEEEQEEEVSDSDNSFNIEENSVSEKHLDVEEERENKNKQSEAEQTSEVNDSLDLDKVCQQFANLKAALSNLENDVVGITKKSNVRKETRESADKEAGDDDIKLQYEMRKCRQVSDLLDTFPPLRYENVKGVVFCNECISIEDIAVESTNLKITRAGVFNYKPEVVTEDNPAKLTENFRNLKKALVFHLKSDNHKKNINENLKKLEAKETSHAEYVSGMALGRMCYNSYKKGRPMTDYESNVLLHDLNGAEIGNINHSNNFPRRLLPFVAEVVMEQKMSFLQGRMRQTGLPPEMAITADLATYRQDCRHFVGGLTCVPDSPDGLIQVDK